MHKTFLIFSLAIAVLAIRVLTFWTNVKPYPEGATVAFQARVDNEPTIAASGQKITLLMPNSQKVSVTFAPTPTISYGDLVKVEGEVKYFTSDTGSKIAYMTKPRFEIAESNDNNVISSIRKNIISFYSSSLNNTDSSLMLGIVFGIKSQMPQKFNNNLQKTGLLHVIAASGMNITMAAGFFISIFGLFFRRQLALFLSILGIFGYTMLAGFQPSIVRAAVMGIMVFASQILGRQSNAGFGLAAAAFIMLFINPSLLGDIGFQLSFLATLGLVYLSPIFYTGKKLAQLIDRSFIGGDLVTTITAQIITLPILVINFGSYSPVSILVNGLVLWTVPILMFFGGLGAIGGMLFAPLGHVLTYLVVPILAYFEAVVNAFGSRITPLSLTQVPLGLVGGYYLCLVSIILWARKKAKFHQV